MFFVAKDASDKLSIDATIKLFAELAKNPQNGLGQAFSVEEMSALGSYPGSFLAHANLLDVAPTIASFFGVTMPEAEGRVLVPPK